MDLQSNFSEKVSLIRSQQKTIKLYEKQIRVLEENNINLKQTVDLLIKYITDELHENLPSLPALPSEDEEIHVRMMPYINQKPKTSHKSARKHKPRGLNQSYDAETLRKLSSQPLPSSSTKSSIFDDEIGLYKSFAGSWFLKMILDAQFSRKDMKPLTKYLKQENYSKLRWILFESLSFFLSLRNVAFQNYENVFLPRVLEMISDILEIERVTVFLYDEESNQFYCKAINTEISEQIVVNKDFGHFSYSCEKPFYMNEAADDFRFDWKYEKICRTSVNNVLCYPLKVGDQLIGILECINKRTKFSSEDLPIFEQIVKQLSIGMATYLLKELSKFKINSDRYIERSKDSLVNPVLNSLTSCLKYQLNCDGVAVYTYNENNKEISSTVLLGVEPNSASDIIANEALISQNPIIITDAENHPDLKFDSNFKFKEALCYPINQKGAILCLNKAGTNKFKENSQRILINFLSIYENLMTASSNLEGILQASDLNEVCFQATKEAILHVNFEGLILKANAHAAELFNLKQERIVGTIINEIFENSHELLSKIVEIIKSNASNALKRQKIGLFIGNEMKWINADFTFIPIDSIYIFLIRASKN
ncbi:unnamed protein product [Blepharisma stoltei]|uniref:GAF domain-containing protein n=1 Tax=Blepharisma stoltei TaxID=1481888 RepID=A0AAU9J1Z1_9CILI|nr:unnamed protein product [Blepharisma stoltei]